MKRLVVGAAYERGKHVRWDLETVSHFGRVAHGIMEDDGQEIGEGIHSEILGTLVWTALLVGRANTHVAE